MDTIERATSKSAAPTIKATLSLIERQLTGVTPQSTDGRTYAGLSESLRTLHARVRVHHAESCLTTSDDQGANSPEYIEELTRLSDEHSCILGKLDRLIRTVDSMADRPQEDRDVFLARVREIIAILRRHEAEEDRVFYLAMWRDTGGESG